MAGNQEVDTSVLYTDVERELLDNTSGIMLKLAQSYSKLDLASMSIDKTESVLKIVDSIEKNINKRANLTLKLMALQDTNDDRERLVEFLTNVHLRRAINTPRTAAVELDDNDVIEANVSLAKGELSQGIEQLSLELLDLENNNEGEW